MLRLILAVLLISLVPVIGPSQAKTSLDLKEAPPDFVGDGCTFWPDWDYTDCCRAHDRDYYRGGTDDERKASDKRLRDCVRARGHKYVSKLMYLGVRLGGASWLHTSSSWGFGQKLNKDQKLNKEKNGKESNDQDTEPRITKSN